ncbi:hypothetical protein RM543_14790 [Roseicyclus sp. F158]|uniref:Uncharacterized protein n=1 Tax=Tropicimonas omnivorans TaxID=3075590 RepID=A0ABU3DJT6_9RHOB|nr:hypothetical protein [Roseicyclus sp. F158]MDT0683955.1 hypothetical protein [Roseicyclus sp. F158]
MTDIRAKLPKSKVKSGAIMARAEPNWDGKKAAIGTLYRILETNVSDT